MGRQWFATGYARGTGANCSDLTDSSTFKVFRRRARKEALSSMSENSKLLSRYTKDSGETSKLAILSARSVSLHRTRLNWRHFADDLKLPTARISRPTSISTRQTHSRAGSAKSSYSHVSELVLRAA